jgi:hypothetical protein
MRAEAALKVKRLCDFSNFEMGEVQAGQVVVG